MSNAMQEMLLNMLLPKDQQEQLKRILTPENITNFFGKSKGEYVQLKADIQSIKEDQAKILELLQNDNRSGGRRQLRAIGDASGGTGTDG